MSAHGHAGAGARIGAMLSTEAMADRAGAARRHRIGRGALHDIRPFVAGIVTALPVFLIALPWLLEAFAGISIERGMVVGAVGFFAVLVGLIAFLNLPGSATVGDDGVHVDTRDARRFVPFGEVERVDRFADVKAGKRMVGVLLALRGGDEVKIPFGEEQFGAAERVEALLEVVRSSHAAFGGSAGAEVVAALRPGDATTDRWAEQLRRIGAGAAAGPRIAPVATERLWAVVQDPSEDATARGGAAFALRDRIDAAGKVRLKRIAAGSAQPALRVALEAAAEAEDAAAVEALEALRARTGPGGAA